MFNNFKQKLFTLVFMLTMTATSIIAETHTLTEKQLSAVLSIITNFVVSNSFPPPRLTTSAPSYTTENTVNIEVNGEAGQEVYVNGESRGVIASNGTLSLTLELQEGANAFTLTFKDDKDKTSSPLQFTVIMDTIAPNALTFTEAPSLSTSDTTLSVEVNGEAGAKVYVNGIEKGTISTEGTLTIILNLTFGENDFSLTQKDLAGNKSNSLFLSIEKLNSAPVFDMSQTSLSFVPRHYSYDASQFSPTLIDMNKDGYMDIVSSYSYYNYNLTFAPKKSQKTYPNT